MGVSRITSCFFTYCPNCQSLSLFAPDLKPEPGAEKDLVCGLCHYVMGTDSTGSHPEMLIFEPQIVDRKSPTIGCPLCGELEASDVDGDGYVKCGLCSTRYFQARNLSRGCPGCRNNGNECLHILENDEGHWFFCTGCSQVFWVSLETCPICEYPDCHIDPGSTMGFLFRCPKCSDHSFISRDEEIGQLLSKVGGYSYGGGSRWCDDDDWSDIRLTNCVKRGFLLTEEI